jgi:flagellar biosynthesis GTPase FlhF
LSWTDEWYVREKTLRAANLAIIDYHQRLPLTTVFGVGTLSSSDGQRFPVRGKSTSARERVIHGGRVLSSYTHVTDRHATYGTKVIVATKREAHYVLDEILNSAPDLPITEHATDTHGVTLVNFGLIDLLGMQLSPRIRDLGRITLYRPGPAETSRPGSLLTKAADTTARDNALAAADREIAARQQDRARDDARRAQRRAWAQAPVDEQQRRAALPPDQLERENRARYETHAQDNPPPSREEIAAQRAEEPRQQREAERQHQRERWNTPIYDHGPSRDTGYGL